MMKESMYKAGIVADPTPMDFNLFYKNAANHKFDAMFGGWGSSSLLIQCNYGIRHHG